MTNKNVLILGSAPDALIAKKWDCKIFDKIIAINNSWQIRNDWTYNIFPKDFEISRRPSPGPGQILISEKEYVPAQNFFGGFVYAGGTMAFTAAYWTLKTLKPQGIFFLGCDMIYESGQTHFYGTGTPDPLRADITLRSLEAKAARFEFFAQKNNCKVFNLSEKWNSRLVYRRLKLQDVKEIKTLKPRVFNEKKSSAALNKERQLKYFIEDGKYWKHLSKFDEAKIDKLDSLWLSSLQKI